MPLAKVAQLDEGLWAITFLTPARSFTLFFRRSVVSSFLFLSCCRLTQPFLNIAGNQPAHIQESAQINPTIYRCLSNIECLDFLFRSQPESAVFYLSKSVRHTACQIRASFTKKHHGHPTSRGLHEVPPSLILATPETYPNGLHYAPASQINCGFRAAVYEFTVAHDGRYISAEFCMLQPSSHSIVPMLLTGRASTEQSSEGQASASLRVFWMWESLHKG